MTSSQYSQFHEEVRQTGRLALLTARLWRGRVGGQGIVVTGSNATCLFSEAVCGIAC